MSLPQSPPTTSGIVVLSGSDSFDPQASDFPVIWGTIEEPDKSESLVVKGGGGLDTTNLFLSTSGVGGFAGTIQEPSKEALAVRGCVVVPGSGVFTMAPIAGTIEEPDKQTLAVLGHVLHSVDDVGITSTAVTTSGIVVVDIFPGAGTPAAPFVPPVVINERFFPNFQGTFPEHDRRIFPVLPQFATLTPGD